MTAKQDEKKPATDEASKIARMLAIAREQKIALPSRRWREFCLKWFSDLEG
jgi:hypothetical protein